MNNDLCKVDCLFISICIFYIIGWIELLKLIN